MKKVKALILFSGGLDSILAVKVLQSQGIVVEGICFFSSFYDCVKVRQSAAEIGLNLHEVDIKKEMLDLVKNPPSGYGKHLNPCLDCHAMMIRLASQKKGYDFVASGEVLGQRPFSQNRESLARVQELAGAEVLRPLSAKLLPATEIEKKGLVVRGKLFGIKGRGREKQMELARKFKINKYASPAGGCLLTDPEFSQRLLLMLERWPKCGSDDTELLKHGRVFWLKPKKGNYILLIAGRHQEDNEELVKIAKKDDIVLELKKIKGPTSLLRGLKALGKADKQIVSFELQIPDKLQINDLKLDQEKNKEEILEIAGLLTGWYATKARGKVQELEARSVK